MEAIDGENLFPGWVALSIEGARDQQRVSP